MQNKYIFNLIGASLLWSLIPVIVTNLFKEISLLTILFLRFLMAGLFFLFLSFIFIYFNNKRAKSPEMKILIRNLFKHMKLRNKKFFNLKFVYYYLCLGFFGIILQVIFYFLSLKETTIAFTMTGYQITIIIVAFYEHGVKSERLDFFKVLYLLVLIFCIAIISYVYLQLSNPQATSISMTGFFYVLLMAACMAFLQLSMGKESYTKEEIDFANRNRNFKLVKLLFKISLVFLIGILTLFPFLFCIYIFPIPTVLSVELTKFLYEITILPSILFRWEILFLIFFSTVIPYLLFFIASVNWHSYFLTFSQWESILSLIEPIGGILFGVLLIGQYFPTDFLIIVLFLLGISILFRFAHESRNKINALLLVNQKPGMPKSIPLKLLKLSGIHRVDSLIGTNDYLLNVKTSSIKELYYLIDSELKKIEGIKVKEILFINKINKLTS